MTFGKIYGTGAREAMERIDTLQDSGLIDSRLLARLAQAGVIVLDGDATVVCASPDACALLGASGERDLRARWDAIAAELRLGATAGETSGPLQCGHADIATPEGPKSIRFEIHAAGGERHRRVLLLRERASLPPADRMLFLASEALIHRHALPGLVHAAKGPLNNFNLTLALLASSIEHAGNAPVAPEMHARWNRYLDVLRAEAVRLGECFDEMSTLAMPRSSSRERIDIGALVRDVVRMLHHDAAMQEVDLEAALPDAPVRANGDPHLVRTALLSLTVTMLGVTSAGGRVVWRVTTGDDDGGAAALAITTSQGVLPPELVADLERLGGNHEADHSAAIAARVIVESQGGAISVEDGARGPAGFRVSIPARAEPAP